MFTAHPVTREAASPWHESVQSSHLAWSSPSRGGKIPHTQGTKRAGSMPEWEGHWQTQRVERAGASASSPPHSPILQQRNTIWVTSGRSMRGGPSR